MTCINNTKASKHIVFFSKKNVINELHYKTSAKDSLSF